MTNRWWIRILIAIQLALLGIFFLMRATASACSGAGCDWYIPASVLVPLLIFTVTMAIGIAAAIHAGRTSVWFGSLVAVTVLGAVGPLVALLVLRDRPDAFVVSATVLELLVNLTALFYTTVDRRVKRAA